MWDSGNRQRKRRGLGEQQDRKSLHFHLSRIWADLRYQPAFERDPKSIGVRFIINDFTVHGVSVFSPVDLPQGQPISLFLTEPRQYFVQGVVQSAVLLSLKESVRFQRPLPYRLIIHFTYQSVDEIQAAQVFCQEIAEEVLAKNSKARKVA